MSDRSGRLAWAAGLALGALALASPSTKAAEQAHITIGTGGMTGVYYPAGGAICRIVNKGMTEHGVRCAVKSTGGSVYNITAIRAGALEMGIAQSDWQYHAYNGTGEESFKKAGPFKELRAIFSIHAEPVSLVARADAGIETVHDLAGKRVNIGNPGSGAEATWNVMWDALGHGNAELGLASRLMPEETPRALCGNEIDAYFWLAGNPNRLNREAAAACDVIFVPVEGPEIDKLVAENSFYRHAAIPGGLYRGSPNDVPTFGVGATFVTSTATPEKTVYEVVKAVFENLAYFKRLHPAFRGLKESEMIEDALSAPLHSGALKYYKEKGWM